MNHLIRIQVQKNHQDISYTTEYNEDHHQQIKKIWH